MVGDNHNPLYLTHKRQEATSSPATKQTTRGEKLKLPRHAKQTNAARTHTDQGHQNQTGRPKLWPIITLRACSMTSPYSEARDGKEKKRERDRDGPLGERSP